MCEGHSCFKACKTSYVCGGKSLRNDHLRLRCHANAREVYQYRTLCSTSGPTLQTKRNRDNRRYSLLTNLHVPCNWGREMRRWGEAKARRSLRTCQRNNQCLSLRCYKHPRSYTYMQASRYQHNTRGSSPRAIQYVPSYLNYRSYPSQHKRRPQRIYFQQHTPNHLPNINLPKWGYLPYRYNFHLSHTRPYPRIREL